MKTFYRIQKNDGKRKQTVLIGEGIPNWKKISKDLEKEFGGGSYTVFQKNENEKTWKSSTYYLVSKSISENLRNKLSIYEDKELNETVVNLLVKVERILDKLDNIERLLQESDNEPTLAGIEENPQMALLSQLKSMGADTSKLDIGQIGMLMQALNGDKKQ